MNRYDFMRQLEILLSDITPSERQEALQFYNDYFDDAGAENEQDVIKALGSPAKVAASIKADLTGNAAAGEFTETGYKDFYSRNQEIMKYDQPDQKTRNQENQGGNSTGQSDSYNNPYSNSGAGKNPYSNSGAGKNPYSNNPYGSNPYGNNPYSSNRAGNAQNSNGQNSNNQSRNGTAQGGTYQGNNNNNTSYNNNGYNNTNEYAGTYRKKGMSGGTLALVIVLCIIGIPILIPIGVGLLGLAIAIVAVIASLFLAVAATAFALIIVGVVFFVVGISKLFISPFGGLYLAGGGLACIGMGILFAMLTIWLCVVVVPAVIKAIIALCSKLFSGRRASKA